MYRLLYGIDFWEICLGLLAFYTVWSYVKVRLGKHKVWKAAHIALLLLWLGVSLYIAIFDRSAGNGDVNLTPFWSYKIAFKGSYDYFQQIYLNVLAFFVFGLTAPELLRTKYKYLAVIVCAAFLSVAIEFLQFKMDVGLAEFDDVFSNTLGAVIGAAANRISGKYVQVVKRWKESLLRFLHRLTTE